MTRWAAALCCAALLGACSPDPGPAVRPVLLVAGDARLEIAAEVADEPSEHARGLMGRARLGPREGMLFVFAQPRARSFWMSDTLIPLDLLVMVGGRVAQVIRMEPCTAARPGDCPRYRTMPTDLALELPAGVAERAGIGVGASVELLPLR